LATGTIAANKANLAAETYRAAPAYDRDSAAPVLDRRTSAARLLARLIAPTRPVRCFLAGLVLSYAAIAAASILLGLLVTDVLIANHTIAIDDGRFVQFLSHHRTPGLTEASLIGSIIAGGVVLPIVAAVCGLLAAIFRQWRVAAFLIAGLAIESAAYRTTTLVVPRHRPDVIRLEHLPVNASYPSGHTAASIVVYGGIALLATSRISRRAARTAVWSVAAAIPVYVALSRMYRGMHHPFDIAGGAAIGITTLFAIVLVSRAAGIAAANRDAERGLELEGAA
jgi:membrane-associated phospholipid phosphatase